MEIGHLIAGIELVESARVALRCPYCQIYVVLVVGAHSYRCGGGSVSHAVNWYVAFNQQNPSRKSLKRPAGSLRSIQSDPLVRWKVM
jgi:hypothetical protein